MKARLLLLGLASAACAFGAYTYDYSATPLSYSSSQWSLNGTVDAATPATRFNSGGSYIWTPTVSGTNANDYEIDTAISIAIYGGTFIHFVRASSNAQASPGACAGSYISVEISTASSTYSQPVAAQLTVNQCVSGSVTQLGSGSITVRSGAAWRTVVWGTTLWVFLDNRQIWAQSIPSTTGNPGIGGYGMWVAGAGLAAQRLAATIRRRRTQ